MDILDNLIAALMILFILSIITEKFTTLIRKYPVKFQFIFVASSLTLLIISIRSGQLLLFFIFLVLLFLFLNQSLKSLSTWHIQSAVGLNSFQNIAKEGTNKGSSQEEKEVTLLSFAIGFFVALLFDASIIDILQYNPESSDFSFGTPDYVDFEKMKLNDELEFSFIAFVGLLATGFFLSFGSKFFHDLIDNLLQIKNLKRKLNDKETYKVSTIEEFDEYLKITEGEAARRAIKENLERLESQPNFVGAHIGSVDFKRTKRKVVFIDI